MRRWALIWVVVLWSCLGGAWVAAQVAGRAELEQQLLAYINERMYNSCAKVVLNRQVGDTYEGFVLFTNGQRNNLRVTVRGAEIDYEFLGWSEAQTEQEPPEPPSTVHLQREVRQLQDRLRAQQREIARLRGHNGAAARRPSHVYTQQMYRSIERGLSYAQVADLLGDAGARISSSYFAGGVNEVWLWVNPDDSHLCVVFRDGAVLVRTQSGLAPALPGIEGPRAEVPYFDNWLLAHEVAGRIVPLDLSFGQWLNRVRERASKNVSPPRIDIIEEDNRIIVEVTQEQAGHPAKQTRLYLTWMSPQDPALDAPELATVDGVCLPAGMQMDGSEDLDPARTWEVMAALADLR